MATTTKEDDKTDTTHEETEAPRDLADGEVLDGVDLKAFGLEPPAPAATDQPAEKGPTAQRTPAAEREPERSEEQREPAEPERPGATRRQLRAALSEERQAHQRTKETAERYRLIAEAARGRATTQDTQINLRGTVPQSIAAPKLTPQQREDLLKAARTAQNFADPAAAMLDAVERLFEGHAQSVQKAMADWAVAQEEAHRVQDTARRERAFTRDHPDYPEVVRASGINDLLFIDPRTRQPGPHFNPKVAQEIAEADNPVEAAYWISRGLLGRPYEEPVLDRRHLNGDEPITERTPSPSDRRAEPTDRPTDRRPAETTERPARQAPERGGAPGPDRVVDSSARPKTVRDLQPAPSPTGFRLDETFRGYLDKQWDTNPEGVLKLFKDHPRIQRWYEG